jgi:antitoxin ParD1/3/4
MLGARQHRRRPIAGSRRYLEHQIARALDRLGDAIDKICQDGHIFCAGFGVGLMATMNVSLSDEFAAFVEGEVASGGYASASEVVRDGLRLLQREKAAHQEKVVILRREVGIGVQQARSGRLSKRSVGEIAGALDLEDNPSP